MSEKRRIGVVGLGLMGSSIVTCILAAGHEVTALTRNIERSDEARKRITNFLVQLQEEKMFKRRS
jgi:3-hydroxybutyryl-CoA dehydrogenase